MPQSSPAVGERRPGPRRGNLGVESLRLNQSHREKPLFPQKKERILWVGLPEGTFLECFVGIDLPLGSREDLGVEQWCAGPETRS
jgi:hypothetical protein